MHVLSIKLPAQFDDRLRAEARRSGRTMSAIVREALEAWVASRAPTFEDLAGDLAGSLEAPADLSTNPEHLVGFGS